MLINFSKINEWILLFLGLQANIMRLSDILCIGDISNVDNIFQGECLFDQLIWINQTTTKSIKLVIMIVERIFQNPTEETACDFGRQRSDSLLQLADRKFVLATESPGSRQPHQLSDYLHSYQVSIHYFNYRR